LRYSRDQPLPDAARAARVRSSDGQSRSKIDE